MIGKVRQQNDNSDQPARTTFRQGCGVLRHHVAPGSYRHVRYAPAKALSYWVKHVWVEEWDLLGSEPQTREVLPHPNVQFVFAAGRSRIFGVQSQRFIRRLTGQDRILGITFRAGAFYPFFRKPVFSITNQSIEARRVFDNADDAESDVLASIDDHAMVQAASRFLLAHLPPQDPHVETAWIAVNRIADDPSITKVSRLASCCGLHRRTLERLFTRYVGATAQTIIKRYRMYDVLERLNAAKSLDWAAMAQDMGYFDQAHFINDFKKSVGCSPAAYFRRSGG